MKRRSFIQALAAAFAVPANATVSLQPAVAASMVPAKARFWAIYTSALHGECTPQMLQNLTQIPASEAKSYLSQLMTEGVLRKDALLKNASTRLVGEDKSLWDKVRNRAEMKSETNTSIADDAITSQNKDIADDASSDQGDTVESAVDISKQS